MPRATNNIEDTERHDLKTCPGGFVELRRMTYGQYLQRQSMAMDMQMQTSGKGKGSQGATIDIDMSQMKVAEFEFRHCVASHNLEDHEGALLDFRQAHTLQLLDPRIGQEIGDLIDAMNTFEDDLGN
jgi:hypothetical protein